MRVRGVPRAAIAREDEDMIVMPHNKRWSDLTVRQRLPLVLRGIVQFVLLAAALADIYRRPAEEIKGSKWLWSVVAMANFMGIGPIVYFLFGRKRKDQAG
jgi:hypothetical protein